MKRLARLILLGVLAAAWPAVGADAVSELERGLRELEGLVRQLQATRAGQAAELERARAAAARADAEARDLDREAAAIEDEAAGLRESVARLEAERRELDARRARATASRSVTPRRLASVLRKAREEAAAAGACAVEGESVLVGPRRMKRDDEPGRAIAEQLERRAPAALVRLRWSLEGLERR